MRAITLFLIIWSASSFANDPPNLPFRPLDESMMAVKPGNSADNSNTNQISEQVFGKQAPATEQARPPNVTPKPKKKTATSDNASAATKTKKTPDIDIGLQSGITIKPKPGRTENAVIAKDKLNPIITPFGNPKVLTVDQFESKVEGAVVYISTSSDMPISMFIADIDDPGTAAVSLQLTPKDLTAPVEIRIEAIPSKVSPHETMSKADAVRHDSPYVDDIKSIMQNLGKQQIPQGFTLEESTHDLRLGSVCHDANLTFMPGQSLSGHDSRILVMVAQNNGLTASVFEEAYCAGEDVMAVAAWPKVRLEPGEKTEVFILMRLPQGKNGEEFRPALL